METVRVTIGEYPIVIVLNNSGYGTEQPMLDGGFNDVSSWRYARLPEFFGPGKVLMFIPKGISKKSW